MGSSQRANLIDKAGASQIKRTPGVCGGAACVRDTRIPVWTLIRLTQLGRDHEQLIADFPGLTRADLGAVQDYYQTHTAEIELAIAAEEHEASTRRSESLHHFQEH
jgi:uncharacterized protein (DUF433 family)